MMRYIVYISYLLQPLGVLEEAQHAGAVDGEVATITHQNPTHAYAQSKLSEGHNSDHS